MSTRASTIDSHAAPAHTDRNCTTATATDGATGSELEEAVVTCICRRDRDNGRTFLTDTLDRDRIGVSTAQRNQLIQLNCPTSL